ncbi:hypothetical protein [Veillonella parvula]|uniref:DUF3857 domain-containing protein n=1 Tax=Veillonella parvula TaxID=29466 RepID=A0AB38YP86_VEIPA|nr:hypothetical protein [Veillonella parvula]EFB85871.1 hypothetical protein HMPREF1035_0548 [Veillonella parvula ATCC 17745]WMS19648.1 hypothetical protein RDV51_09480 [Veillonella parvula]
MTKLPLLACAFIMSTILSPIGAIDVNIPGADSKISKDAYINYQTANPDIEKDVANYVKTLKLTDKANGINKNEIEYTKAASIYRGQNYHNTVISVHDQYNQIRLSFPVAGIKSDYHTGRYQNPSRTIEDYRVLTNNGSLDLEIDYADFKDYDWRNTKIAYEKLTDKDVRNFLQDNAKRKSSKQISDIKGTVFSYPTVTYSTWDSMKMPHFENGKKTTLTIDTINFKFKGYNMRYPLYHVGFVYYDNIPALNKIPTDKLLANYVLPSVQNLNELNQYSRIENLNGVLYRVPKDAIYVGEEKGTEYQDIRSYKKGNITFFVSTNNIPKNPYARDLVVNGHYNFKINLDTFWDIYYSQPTSDYINYAVIWNNNIPGLSTHIYTPHKDDHILTFNSYDGTYSFTYIIFYPSFLHAEEVQKLRNMIEFFDSTTNPSFKLQEHVLFPEA